MIALVIAIAFGLLGSFVCSLCEAALYSVSDTRVAAMVHNRVPGAKLLAKLRANIDRAIAAILTFNTIANTVGASVAGAIVAAKFGNLWLGVFSGLFTLGILFGSEIIPKSIGVAHADFLAPRVAWIIEGMIILMYPLVIVCGKMTRRIVRNAPISAPTEHEILSMLRLAARHGELPAHEAEMVANALKLDQFSVRQVMTPRPVVFALPHTLPLESIEKNSEHWVHSRLPVVRDDNPDEVLGVVHRRDVFDLLVHDEEGDKTLADVMRPVQFIRDDARADVALQRFLSGRQHMFIVVDEYGLFVGIITLEDVLETLLGREIVGEHDPVTDMQALARRKLAERGIRLEGEIPSKGPITGAMGRGGTSAQPRSN